ncbi:TonB-dependent receptor plug domain-containing protein [Opitutus sp. ER46]|uniref:TonB-dependent siderophore receptor n=1 Tax=Opitutus sp. ER46 TaxID=2161864 RepID=UPI000D3212DA|nr:TonB-dependent receptor plug domain-containing protein [Opitutus sp. ER46]PTX91002.1 hypothetical protein DB354_20370 [Opitutus sp. ER46]
MNTKYRTYLLLAGCAAALTTARAQGSPPNDEPVTLSPFTVSGASDKGYIASESMTGTRVATQIKDLPFSVNVLTSEFFEDFALFELNENVAYISSFTMLDQGGAYNLRGFNQTFQLRDGFFRLGRYGSSNIDRIEVIKGPNASIYGQSSPGGLINMISKRPKKRTAQKVSVSAGSYDTNREVLESTGPLGSGGRTFYVSTLGFYERGYETEMAQLRNKEFFTGVQHFFRDESSLLLQVEYVLREQHSPPAGAPEIYDSVTKQYTGIARNLGTLQELGPNSELNRGMFSATGVYEKTFNPVWSLRVGANYFRARRWDFNQNTVANQLTLPAMTMTRAAAPTKTVTREEGGGLQSDLLAHYWMANHRVENRDLLTFDFNDYYAHNPQWAVAGTDLAKWTPIRTFKVGDSIPFYLLPFDYAQARYNRNNKNRTTIFGGLFRHQSAFLDGRVLFYTGVRFDYVRFSLRDLVKGANARFLSRAWSPNVGVNVKATRNLAVYANRSNGFTPNAQQATASNILPNETSYGYDYGLKGSYLDDRLNFTVGGFYVVRRNVAVTELDELGLPHTVADGSHLVRGFEVDLNWRITEPLSVGGSWGHIDSRITDFGYQYMSVGRSPAKISPDNFGVYAKYNFLRGPLTGLSSNLGVTYVAATPLEGPAAGDTYVNGVYTGTNNQWQLKTWAYATVNLGVHYAFPPGRGKFRHRVGLNVNNLLDKEYITPTNVARVVGDRRSFYLQYTLSH